MIRIASPEDEPALVKLCNAVYDQDYVLDFLSTWLQKGSVWVYETEVIVGMIRLIYLPDQQAHLGAVRVHPEYRRQGIATALTEHLIYLCQCDKVRLAIMDNKASRKVAENIGFSQVAVFTCLSTHSKSKSKNYQKTLPNTCTQETPQKAFKYLKNSSLFNQGNSFLSKSFSFYTPSISSLGKCHIIGNGTALAIIEYDVEEATTPAIQLAYCDPNPEIIQCVHTHAARNNMEEIWAVIPKNETLVTCLKSQGFSTVSWSETITVFELVI
ncbi:MAG: GNAT family N-acetyltransferase [Candidatus Methanofastidiosia archaeon]|jgi:GNAT superfamily N-acetyltransferase